VFNVVLLERTGDAVAPRRRRAVVVVVVDFLSKSALNCFLVGAGLDYCS
jgi:hypoxanthine-guanine phosphoribosyltransferase